MGSAQIQPDGWGHVENCQAGHGVGALFPRGGTVAGIDKDEKAVI